MHGYVPHHTKEYLARQALNRKERVVQGASKGVSNMSRRQQVASAVPGGPLNALSSALPPAPKLPEVAYHDDSWKMPVDITHSYPPQPLPSQSFPLLFPSQTWPGYGTHNAIQPFPPVAQSPPSGSLPTSVIPSDFTIDYYSDLLGPQLYTMPMQSQEQEIGESLTVDHSIPHYNGNGQWNWPPQY